MSAASFPSSASADLSTRLAALSAKASQGEWSFDGPRDSIIIWSGHESRVCFMTSSCPAQANAAFITELANAYRSGALRPAPPEAARGLAVTEARRETFDRWFEANDQNMIASMSKRAVACEAWHHIRRVLEAAALRTSPPETVGGGDAPTGELTREIERIFAEHGAWVANPNRQVAEKVAFACLARAHAIAHEGQQVDVEAAIPRMVSRFLGWTLPADFSPDAGITYTPGKTIDGSALPLPVGTNLLTAIQAEAMVRHILEGLSFAALSSAPPAEETWQAIDENTPRDGRPILYWDSRSAIPETVCFLNGSKVVSRGWYPYAGGGWFVADGKEPPEARWRPLPPAPAGEAT